MVVDIVEELEIVICEVFEGCFGVVGFQLVLEEWMEGFEVLVFVFCDGEWMVLLLLVQDYKCFKDGDFGFNIGGMGVYVFVLFLSVEGFEEVCCIVFEFILKVLCEWGIDYCGVIYVGLMIMVDGFQVIEFNCCFGDFECQILMFLFGFEFGVVLQVCVLGCLDLVL